MQKLYTKSYIKIYFWRFISIISGFLSLLIVIPHLSNNVELYGIYSFCISFTLYLSYADIGFLSAGQKYASEAFAKGDRKEETEILGFTGAVLLLMIAPFSLAMIFFSFYPEMVLSDLSEAGAKISGNIFLIIGVILPFQIIIQRLVQSILIIRIKDYISLRIDVVSNLIKILSVFYFFSNEKYMLVEYYFFVTIITIISSLIILVVIRKSEKYDFVYLLKCIKFRKKEFNKVKKLSISSLFLTIGWLIYYELDLIIIGKWFGTKEVAIYAIAFTFLNFLRTLWNSVFSPYAQRFNHFVGVKSKVLLKNMIANIIDYTFPLCVIVTVVLIVISSRLTIFWVGEDYIQSTEIMQILIAATGFSFITKPASFYFSAKTKYKYIYLLSIVLPLTFLLSVFILTPKYGILGISISKTFAMFVGFILSTIGLSEIYNPIKIIKKWFFSVSIVSILIVYLLPPFLNLFFNHLKESSKDLMLLIFIAGTLILISYLSVLLTKKEQRKNLKLGLNLLKIKLFKK